MRLLVVTQYFWPENFRINDLVTELARKGHDVTVLTGWPNYPEGKVFEAFRNSPGRYSILEDAKIVRVPLLPRRKGSINLALNYVSFAVCASLIGPWKLRGARFDAVFFYEPSPITVALPGILMRIFKQAPMVLWVLDLWPETLSAVGGVKSKRILSLVGKLVSFIYRRCDLILAQSKSFIPEIRRYAGCERRIEYFPSWAESVFGEEAIEPATELSSGAGYFTIMFAGNIGEAQDFPAILSAVDKLRDRSDIRWVFVGDGRMSDWVSKEIDARGLRHNVKMLGRHPIERMPSFFKHADAMLVTLKNQPIFGMTIPGKLQSYLATGIPVVAMLNGVGAQLLDDAGAGLTCPAGDFSALADAVRQLADMPTDARRAMGARGRALYAREFERGGLIGRLDGWLNELVAAKMQGVARS